MLHKLKSTTRRSRVRDKHSSYLCIIFRPYYLFSFIFDSFQLFLSLLIPFLHLTHFSFVSSLIPYFEDTPKVFNIHFTTSFPFIESTTEVRDGVEKTETERSKHIDSRDYKIVWRERSLTSRVGGPGKYS